MEYPIIAQKIIKLKDEDLVFRDKLIANGQLGDGYNKDMEAIHIKNANQLSDIIEEIGYPIIEKVGKAGAEAAWLIIQHAISKPAFMKRCQILLKEAVAIKLANPIYLAYLTDRIATLEDKVQLYGTAFDWDDEGIMNPKPYDDLAKVNQRRTELGLNSLEEQIKIIREQTKTNKEKPAVDQVLRKRQYDDWRKSVGWIF